MNSLKIAVALRALADAFEEGGQDAAAETPVKQTRGRGRPAKGEENGTAAPAGATSAAQVAAVVPAAGIAPASAPAATASEADPFADPKTATPVVVTATQDEVRKALTALREASTQEKALKVLKDAGGVANITELKPEKYGTVVAAVNVELRIIEAAKATPAPEADPFEVAAEATPATKVFTLEDVKAEVLKASKRTSQDTVAKVVMDLGGKAAKPEGGFGPSWKALPESKYAEAIAAVQALPTTK